ncbi:hypothetical protein PHYSODRAFT_498366, partial [Phytophthora sojae]
MTRSTESDGPTGSVPLFVPILPPKITSISHEALVKWQRDRRDYETKLCSRCRISGEDYDIVAESIKEAFDEDLLEVLCELQLDTTPAAVTDTILLAEIERIVDSVKNDALPDIKELLKRELRMNMSESDVTARVLDYFILFNKITKENGLTACFSHANGVREKCKRLVSQLKPEAVKNEVKQCIRFTHVPAATDPKLLFKLVVEKANEHER